MVQRTIGTTTTLLQSGGLEIRVFPAVAAELLGSRAYSAGYVVNQANAIWDMS